MKLQLSLIVLFSFLFTNIHAQTVVQSRTAVLVEGGYSISGNAILEELSNGNLQLRLDDDFATPPGPDVRVFLSDDPISTRNGVQVEDLGTGSGGINHFRGAITFDVPAGTNIDDFDYIVFYCVDFRQHWASGNFGGSEGGTDPAPAEECVESIAATTNWTTEVTICPNDDIANDIPLLNTLMIPAGDTYAYIITDDNNRIEEVVTEGTYDFEGSGLGTNRVYGISYAGELNYTAGAALSSITASGCAILSSTTTFLTVLKEDCNPAFECQQTIAATTNWTTEVTICENDGEADIIPLLNTLMIPAGDNYAYIITDENNLIQEVVFEDAYDFEGAGLGINRVYGVSFDTNLNYTIGNPLTSITADGCLMLSDNSTFLTVTKVDCTPAFECQQTSVSTNGQTSLTVCEGDGVTDRITLSNSLNIPTGDNYAYIITDENNLIQEVIFENTYEFEGSGLGVNRVYGVSFDTNLNYTTGNPLTSITADGCTILSSTSAFLTVTKVDCTPVFECQQTSVSANGQTSITVCEGDGVADRITLSNSLNIPTGENYAYIITDGNNLIQEVIFENTYEFEGTGLGVNRVFGVSFEANLNAPIGNSFTSITADGCAIVSTNFLVVTKETCTATISGRITSQAGLALEGFQVSLNDIATTTTTADGFYEFIDVPTNATYEITPSENANLSEGVTAFDLVLVTKHILGIEPFATPFQTIAADANKDNRVTTFDIVELNRIILGISNELTNNQSWRFLNNTEAINETFDPSAFSESIVINNLMTDVPDINFLGVKIGDVSSAGTNELLSSKSRSNTTLQFNASDMFAETGQLLEIPITADNFDQISAYQFTINLEGLDFIDIKSGSLDIQKSNFAHLDAHTVTTVWSKAQAFSSQETLFTLVVKAQAPTQLSQAIDFNATVTPAIAYEASGSSKDIDLAFQPIAATAALRTTELLQNEPNPFTHETTIGFHLANSGPISLTVFDAQGKIIFTQIGEYEEGSHQINLVDSENFPSGVMYYQLSAADFLATKKMIRQ